MIYIKVAHKPPLCMNIPTRRLWGPIRSPLDSVGVFLSVLGGGVGGWVLQQALRGWFLNTRGGKPTAAPRLHSSGIQLQGGESRIRPPRCYAAGEGRGNANQAPGNANQAPGKSGPGRSCGCCAVCGCEHDHPGWVRCRSWRGEKETEIVLASFFFPPWKRRTRIMNSIWVQNSDGRFPLPYSRVKSEFIVKYTTLLLWVLLKQI